MLNEIKVSVSDFYPASFLKNDQIALTLAIIATFDKVFLDYAEFWNNYETNLLNPMLMSDSLLDWKALNTISPWRLLWNKDWNPQTKRLLLRDTNFIFSRRLFPDILTLLFQHFFLVAYLRAKTGWRLGITPLPAVLGTSILDYEIFR